MPMQMHVGSYKATNLGRTGIYLVGTGHPRCGMCITSQAQAFPSLEPRTCCQESVLEGFLPRRYSGEGTGKKSLRHASLFTEFIVEHSEHQMMTD